MPKGIPKNGKRKYTRRAHLVPAPSLVPTTDEEARTLVIAGVQGLIKLKTTEVVNEILSKQLAKL